MKTTALRHRVGSLLIVGVESTSLSVLEMAWLASLQPSGVILFRRNIEAAAALHALWQQASAVLTAPFFRCVDLEGGTVDRLRDLVGPTPSAAEVAATNQPAVFRASGAMVGRMLHALGFNLDLAPVLDLAMPASREVMRTRVVSADPAKVIAYAREFIAGLRQQWDRRLRQTFPWPGRWNFGFTPCHTEHPPNMGTNVEPGSGAVPCAADRAATGHGESRRLSENRAAVATGLSLSFLD